MNSPREHYIANDSGDICWFEWGQQDNGPTLLLLHATGFHARIWDQVVAHLPPETHVIAPDHLGHGRSLRPASLGDWRVTADALLPLVSHFAGTPLIGCGHSMGGYVLSRLAAKRQTAFSHLVLIDPTIFDPATYASSTNTAFPDPADHPIARRRNDWDGPDQMVSRFADRLPYSTWQPEVLADYATYGLIATAEGEGWVLACPPALEASVYHGALLNSPHDWLAKLSTPATVIRAKSGDREGMLDFSQSPTWPALGNAIGAVCDEQWPEHSHFIPMEAPQRVADLLASHRETPNQG